MSGPPDLAAYKAVLFDLDGVITRTATVHALAWKALFDEFLEAREGGPDEALQPFELPDDYVSHVDGRPRYDGVAAFLRSRRIELLWGDPGDGPDEDTVCGLGNRKDRHFLGELERRGVEVFDDAVALLDAIALAGMPVAVVSASRNCDLILERVGLLERFDVRVTGNEAAAWKLPGKPEPATFLKAAELLGLEPADTVVIEDSISGVRAGRAAGCGLVIGVDRNGAGELAAHGADVVVVDLAATAAHVKGSGTPR